MARDKDIKSERQKAKEELLWNVNDAIEKALSPKRLSTKLNVSNGIHS